MVRTESRDIATSLRLASHMLDRREYTYTGEEFPIALGLAILIVPLVIRCEGVLAPVSRPVECRPRRLIISPLVCGDDNFTEGRTPKRNPKR